MIPSDDSSTGDLYDEYMIIEGSIEKVGEWAVDLSDYVTNNALTTKLIIVNGISKYKYTLSGIDVRAVLNMMKENFGISENKIYIAMK